MNIWKYFALINTSNHPDIRQLVQDFESDLQQLKKSPSSNGTTSSIQAFKQYVLSSCERQVRIDLEVWDQAFEGVKNDQEKKFLFREATKDIVVSENSLITLAEILGKTDSGKELRALAAKCNNEMIVLQFTFSED